MRAQLLVAGFAVAACAAPALATQVLTTEFDVADVDRDGAISIEELTPIAEIDVTMFEFNLFDQDRDSGLDQDEFERWTIVNGGDALNE